MIQSNIFNNIDELKVFLKYKIHDIYFENLIRNVRNFVIILFYKIKCFIIDFYELIEKLSINRSKLKNDRWTNMKKKKKFVLKKFENIEQKKIKTILKFCLREINDAFVRICKNFKRF